MFCKLSRKPFLVRHGAVVVDVAELLVLCSTFCNMNSLLGASWSHRLYSSS